MEYNDMQLLKRRMFAMRNGVIADVLRRGGSKFPVIFGVNLPQLAEIAREFGCNREFAERVWANTATRESMLIAPMLMPPEEMTREMAERWIAESPEPEVTDVLCLKLLRKQPYALQLAQDLIKGGDYRYAGLRLMCNLAPQHTEEAVSIGRAEAERNDPSTAALASILLSYAD